MAHHGCRRRLARDQRAVLHQGDAARGRHGVQQYVATDPAGAARGGRQRPRFSMISGTKKGLGTTIRSMTLSAARRRFGSFSISANQPFTVEFRHTPCNLQKTQGERMAIPAFGPTHILPPFVGEWPAAGAGYAPYTTTISELAATLGFSPERRHILVGLLDVRAALCNLGIEIKFQWLNGSFCEHIEQSAGRPPGDIDVMTFFERPPNASGQDEFSNLVSENHDLFHNKACKEKYKCDHFLNDLSIGVNIWNICYWHSLFTHRRDGAWKGYLVVVGSDSEAETALRHHLITQGVVA